MDNENFLGALNMKKGEVYKRRDLVNEYDLDPDDSKYPEKVVEVYADSPILMNDLEPVEEPKIRAIIYDIENGERKEIERLIYRDAEEKMSEDEEKAVKRDLEKLDEFLSELVPQYANDPTVNEIGIRRIHEKLRKKASETDVE